MLASGSWLESKVSEGGTASARVREQLERAREVLARRRRGRCQSVSRAWCSLGYGKFVRADRVFAVVPLEPEERGDGRRTYVHVDGLAQPIVASRSERAILADVEAALTEAAGIPRRRGRDRKGQDESRSERVAGTRLARTSSIARSTKSRAT